MASGTPSAEESARAAAVYERWAAPLTGQFVPAVLDAAAPVGAGTRVLDVATGTGVAAAAAAAAGATVLATDMSPGMVAAAAAALGPYPDAAAVVADGTALADIPDGAYEVALSVFGVVTFPQWEAGLRELLRVTAPGGRLVLTTWTAADGAAFLPIVMDTYRQEFPDKPSPALGAGVAALCTPAKLTAALVAAGAERVTVTRDEQVWDGPPAATAVDELTGLLARAPFYAALTDDERARLHPRLGAALARYAGDDGVVRIPATALVALAHKPVA